MFAAKKKHTLSKKTRKTKSKSKTNIKRKSRTIRKKRVSPKPRSHSLKPKTIRKTIIFRDFIPFHTPLPQQQLMFQPSAPITPANFPIPTPTAPDLLPIPERQPAYNPEFKEEDGKYDDDWYNSLLFNAPNCRRQRQCPRTRPRQCRRFRY